MNFKDGFTACFCRVAAYLNNCLQRTPNRANARSGAAEAERYALNTMEYRLSKIAVLCSENGLQTSMPDKNRIDVKIRDGCILSFLNLVDENDTLVGFDGTPWHSHGIVQFMTGSNTYIECDELDIIVGLVSGELIIVSQVLQSKLTDRWIMHKNEPLDLKYIEPGEELIICRLA